MELETVVAELAQVPFESRSGAILFATIHGYAVVKACQKLKIGILGIDGFRKIEANICPDLGNSCDFSSLYTTQLWANFQKQSCREAISFLQIVAREVDLLEFVLCIE